MVNTTARGVFTEDRVSFQVPEGCMFDLHSPMTVSYTVSGDMSGIDIARSFNMFDLDPNIDVFKQRSPISVIFGNNTKRTLPFILGTVTRPKTIYEKMYEILDKECPSWHYNIKELIEKSNVF